MSLMNNRDSRENHTRARRRRSSQQRQSWEESGDAHHGPWLSVKGSTLERSTAQGGTGRRTRADLLQFPYG